MDKVEAYRCEECEGMGFYPSPYPHLDETIIEGGPYLNMILCSKCNKTGIVWLTEEEVRDRELIADHENKDSGCCGNGCGEECVG